MITYSILFYYVNPSGAETPAVLIPWNNANNVAVSGFSITSTTPEIGVFGNNAEIIDGNTGTGYSTRIATTDGTIKFTGALASGTKTVELTTTGQGFFVKAKTGTSTISFTSAMQSQQASTLLRATATSWPGITLNATNAKATAVGRFYIHIGDNFTTGTSGQAAIGNLKAYTVKGAIIIEGEVSDGAIATLYNLQGLKVRVQSLQKGLLNTLSCPDLMNGIYILTIEQDGKTVTKKLIKLQI